MKLKQLALCAAVTSSSLLSLPAIAVNVDPSDPNIQYTGRWNFDNPSAPWVTWHGSSAKLRFNGTSISVDIDAGIRSPYGRNWKEQYRVIVDGVPSSERIVMDPGRATYTLASGLPAGEHTVELFKETTYAYTSQSTIYGFDIDGTLMAPPARPSLRIEYFGDSNMDGTSNYSEQDQGDSGGYYSYPAQVTRMLGAEMNLQAMGGATLDNGGDNDVQSFIFSPNYDDQDPNYRSDFDPHVIVVNAGANDVGAGKSTIKSRYKQVISDLRTVYGNEPHIVLHNAYGWNPDEPANYSDEVVAEVGGNLSTVKYPWLWEQYHGSMWDHTGQAHMLAEHIASLNPAWSIQNANEIGNSFSPDGNVSNGSFEDVAPFGSYGWRYFDDPGVERVQDAAGAADGSHYLRLTASSNHQGVHQATDATGDLLPGATQGGETYTMTAMIRGTSSGAQAQIETHFQGQELWTHKTEQGSPYAYQISTFNVTTEWQEYSHTFTADAGVWQLLNYLKASQGTVEFDNVQLTVGEAPDPGPLVPVADFSSSASDLSVNFTDASTDSDGSIVSYSWSFGDGSSSNSANPSHTYASEGTYTVTLTVTDNDGQTNSTSKAVTVTEASANTIEASFGSASLNKRGRLVVYLNWEGATGNNVDIYRNGNYIARTANDGAYKDVATNKKSRTYTYQVCNTPVNGGACSALISADL